MPNQARTTMLGGEVLNQMPSKARVSAFGVEVLQTVAPYVRPAAPRRPIIPTN